MESDVSSVRSSSTAADATETMPPLTQVSALARLPADQRLVASLFYGEDLAIEDIAVIAGVPLGTIKSRLHHARSALKIILEGGPT